MNRWTPHLSKDRTHSHSPTTHIPTLLRFSYCSLSLTDSYRLPTYRLPIYSDWLQDDSSDAPLFATLDRVLTRKRLPCARKLEQLEAMRTALASKGLGPASALSGK